MTATVTFTAPDGTVYRGEGRTRDEALANLKPVPATPVAPAGQDAPTGKAAA